VRGVFLRPNEALTESSCFRAAHGTLVAAVLANFVARSSSFATDDPQDIRSSPGTPKTSGSIPILGDPSEPRG